MKVNAAAKIIGLAAAFMGLTTMVGCATQTANTGSANFSSFLSSVTGDATYQPSTSTVLRAVGTVDSEYRGLATGVTTGDLSTLAAAPAWTIEVSNVLPEMQIGPLNSASTDTTPLQVGNVVLIGLKSAENSASGVAAFNMADGSLLWQNRGIECQNIDADGVAICRQDGGLWTAFNPATGVASAAIDPGFDVAGFAFENGVLYTVGMNGAGNVFAAAGTIAEPTSLWVASAPRTADCIVPGAGGAISLSEQLVAANVGSAGIVVNKETGALVTNSAAGQVSATAGNSYLQQACGESNIKLVSASGVTASVAKEKLATMGLRVGEAQVLATGDELLASTTGATVATPEKQTVTSETLHGQMVVNGVTVVAEIDNTLSGYDAQGNLLWHSEVTLNSNDAVTDGERLVIVSGTDANPAVTAIDLHTGQSLWQRNTLDGLAVNHVAAARTGLFSVNEKVDELAFYPTNLAS